MAETENSSFRSAGDDVWPIGSSDGAILEEAVMPGMLPDCEGGEAKGWYLCKDRGREVAAKGVATRHSARIGLGRDGFKGAGSRDLHALGR